MMMVLRNIRENRKIPKGARDNINLMIRQPGQDRFQLGLRLLILIPMKPHRELPDIFDQPIHGLPIQRPNGFPKNAPEQTNIVAQGVIQSVAGKFWLECLIHPRIKSWKGA